MDKLIIAWNKDGGYIKIKIINSQNEIIYSANTTGYDFGKAIASGNPCLLERTCNNLILTEKPDENSKHIK